MSAIVIVGVVAVVTRLVGLEHSLWEDEVRTAWGYVRHGPDRILDPAHYNSNNHVLFSLVAWLLTSVYGLSDVVIRLGAVVPSLVAIAVLTWWLWCRYSHWAAVIAAMLLTVAPAHLELSRQARGYGLTFLGAALMIVGTAEAVRSRGEWRWLAVLGAGGVIGTWALPQVALLFVVHAGVAFAFSSRCLRVVTLVGVVGVASLVFYRPLLGPMTSLASAGLRGRGESVAWHALLTGPADWLLEPIVELATPGSSHAVAVTLGTLVVGFAVVGLVRQQRYMLAANLVVPMLAFFVYFAARGTDIWERYIVFLLLHSVASAAIGLVVLGSFLVRFRGGRPVLAIAASLATISLLGGFGRAADRALAMPHENFEKAVEVATAMEESARIVTNDPRPYPFRYYLLGTGRELESAEPERLWQAVCGAMRPVVFIDYPQRANRGGRERPELQCLRPSNVIEVEISQRAGGGLRVWLLCSEQGERCDRPREEAAEAGAAIAMRRGRSVSARGSR